MADYCARHRTDIKVVTPQLPASPQQAALHLQQLVEQPLVSSGSLGGYLSTWLNSHYGFKAVVVNPAVKPYDCLLII